MVSELVSRKVSYFSTSARLLHQPACLFGKPCDEADDAASPQSAVQRACGRGQAGSPNLLRCHRRANGFWHDREEAEVQCV